MAAFCIWCIIEQRLAGKQIRQNKDKNIRAENGMTGQKSKRQMISATEQERRKSASEYENQKTEESAAAEEGTVAEKNTVSKRQEQKEAAGLF